LTEYFEYFEIGGIKMRGFRNLKYAIISCAFLVIFAVFCRGEETTKTDTQIGFQRNDGEKTKEPTSFTWISNSKNNPVTIYVAKGDDNPAANKIEASDEPAGIEVRSDECGTVSPDSTCTLYFDVDTTLVGQNPTFTIKGDNTNKLEITVNVVKNQIAFVQDVDSINITPGIPQKFAIKSVQSALVPNIHAEFTSNDGAPTDCFSSVNKCDTASVDLPCQFSISVKSDSACIETSSSNYRITISGDGVDPISKPLRVFDTLFGYKFETSLDGETVNTYPDLTDVPQNDIFDSPTNAIPVYYYGKYLIKLTNKSGLGKNLNITGLKVTSSDNIELMSFGDSSKKSCNMLDELNLNEFCYIYFEVKDTNIDGGSEENINITTSNAQRDIAIKLDRKVIVLAQYPTPTSLGDGKSPIVVKNPAPSSFSFSNDTGIPIPQSSNGTAIELSTSSSEPSSWDFTPNKNCLQNLLSPNDKQNSCKIDVRVNDIKAVGTTGNIDIANLPPTVELSDKPWSLQAVGKKLLTARFSESVTVSRPGKLEFTNLSDQPITINQVLFETTPDYRPDKPNDQYCNISTQSNLNLACDVNKGCEILTNVSAQITPNAWQCHITNIVVTFNNNIQYTIPHGDIENGEIRYPSFTVELAENEHELYGTYNISFTNLSKEIFNIPSVNITLDGCDDCLEISNEPFDIVFDKDNKFIRTFKVKYIWSKKGQQPKLRIKSKYTNRNDSEKGRDRVLIPNLKGIPNQALFQAPNSEPISYYSYYKPCQWPRIEMCWVVDKCKDETANSDDFKLTLGIAWATDYLYLNGGSAPDGESRCTASAQSMRWVANGQDNIISNSVTNILVGTMDNLQTLVKSSRSVFVFYSTEHERMYDETYCQIKTRVFCRECQDFYYDMDYRFNANTSFCKDYPALCTNNAGEASRGCSGGTCEPPSMVPLENWYCENLNVTPPL